MIPQLTHELAVQKIAELQADAEAARRARRMRTNGLRHSREPARPSKHLRLVESKP